MKPDRQRDSLQLGRHATASRLELRIADGVDFDDWRSILARVLALSDSSAWWIGDALAYAEWRYGEKYKTVLDELDLAYDQARDYAYVAGNVPPAVRRGDLSFTHHRAVAKLIPAEQEKWLARAAAAGWSKRELLEQLGLEISTSAGRTAVLEQVRISIDTDRHARWETAAERVGATLAEWAIAVLDAEASR